MFIELTDVDGFLRLINAEKINCILPLLDSNNAAIFLTGHDAPIITDESYEEIKEILNLKGLYK